MEGIKLSSESLFDKEQKFRDPPVGYKFDAIELRKLSKAPGQPDSAATKVLSPARTISVPGYRQPAETMPWSVHRKQA